MTVGPVDIVLLSRSPDQPVAVAHPEVPGIGLFLQLLCQVEEKRVTGLIVKPVNHHDILLAPGVGCLLDIPVDQLCAVVQVLILEAEIAGYKRDHPLIACGAVILLKHLEHDHPGPPVVALIHMLHFFTGFQLVFGKRSEIA